MPKVQPYSLEFRREAVGLLRSSGRSVPQLAAELGCSPQSLRNSSVLRCVFKRRPSVRVRCTNGDGDAIEVTRRKLRRIAP
jgi:transposase-like protein